MATTSLHNVVRAVKSKEVTYLKNRKHTSSWLYQLPHSNLFPLDPLLDPSPPTPPHHLPPSVLVSRKDGQATLASPS